MAEYDLWMNIGKEVEKFGKGIIKCAEKASEAAKKRARVDKGSEPKSKRSKKGGAKTRSLSAFNFFVKSCYSAERNKDPANQLQAGEVFKTMGAKWKNLTQEEKNVYEEMAAKDKERFAADQQKDMDQLDQNGKTVLEAVGSDLSRSDEEEETASQASVTVSQNYSDSSDESDSSSDSDESMAKPAPPAPVIHQPKPPPATPKSKKKLASPVKSVVAAKKPDAKKQGGGDGKKKKKKPVAGKENQSAQFSAPAKGPGHGNQTKKKKKKKKKEGVTLSQ